jgi:hypothetical protein
MAQQETHPKYRICCGPMEQGWSYTLVDAVRLAKRWCQELWIDLAIWKGSEMLVLVMAGGEVFTIVDDELVLNKEVVRA